MRTPFTNTRPFSHALPKKTVSVARAAIYDYTNMGRPIKSTEDHIKDGTFRKDRHANRGVKIDSLQELSIPTVLSQKAAEKWEEVVPPLLDKGLISIVDLPELTDAFLHYGFAQDCLFSVLDNYGSVAEYLSKLNKFKDVDLIAEYSKNMERFNRTMHKFGVTPMERAKIKIEPKKEDEGDNFIKSLRGNG